MNMNANVAKTMQSGIMNFTEFFKEEKDVWVKNVCSQNISLEFDGGNGNKIAECVEAGTDPVNLTQSVPFQAIKGSTDFRKILMRQPRALLLMTREQVMAYYAEKARRAQLYTTNDAGQRVPDVDRAIQDADEKRARKKANIETVIQSRTSLTVDSINSAVPAKQTTGEELQQRSANEVANLGREGRVRLDEVVNPRVIHLCQQVSMELDPNERMSAPDLINELKELKDRGEMALESFNHVLSFGTYPTVKAWARQGISELAAAETAALDAANEEGAPAL
jgi:hypothetical protein